MAGTRACLFHLVGHPATDYFEEMRVFQASCGREYVLAWNNKIGFRFYLLVLRAEVMINQ